MPQHRERLITIGKRRAATTVVEHPPFHPTPSHGPNAHRPHVTLRACTAHLPALDAIAHPTDDDDPLHCVPRWTLQQHEWMRATPEGGTAFDNLTCPMCNSTTEDRSSVQCSRCESWLPRPRKRVRGPPESYRPVRAFQTSYRRMVADRPASTLTTNSAVISSDAKGHPTQHRVLSVREVLTVASASPFPDCAEDIQRLTGARHDRGRRVTQAHPARRRRVHPPHDLRDRQTPAGPRSAQVICSLAKNNFFDFFSVDAIVDLHHGADAVRDGFEQLDDRFGLM